MAKRKFPKTSIEFEREWARQDARERQEFLARCRTCTLGELFDLYVISAQPDDTVYKTFSPMGVWKKETIEDIFHERVKGWYQGTEQ